MRRADRLFQIVQLLRQKKSATATNLATHLQVSSRTIYRDIQDLILSQVPIQGEAGVGYRLAPGFDIPPLMFRPDELEALILGAHMVMAWGDKDLAEGATQALSKIEQVLPRKLAQTIDVRTLFAPEFHIPSQAKSFLHPLRKSIAEKREVALCYRDADDRDSERKIHPLGLFFWGSRWSLLAFCETRQDFRSFRLDRMQNIEVLNTRFSSPPGRTLQDFLQKKWMDD